jgi:SAM-dependent methyltransferase
VACLACGEVDVHPWRTARTADVRASSPVYRLGRCAACGTAVTLSRTATDGARLYRGGAYAPALRSTDVVVGPLRRLGERAALRALGGTAPGQSVLEIGAGDGRLVDALRRRGCVVTGIEPFAAGRAFPGVEAVRAEDAAPAPAKYDLAVLWHVLEHLDEPLAVLRATVRALRPGGRVVVSVPTLDSLQARIGGDRWFHQDVPRHLLHFTRAGLARLLERSGLAVTRVRDFVPDQNLLGMTQTLLNRLTREPNVAFRLLKGDTAEIPLADVLVSAIAAVPFALSGSALEAGAMLARRGGAIVVEAVPGRAA